MSIMRRSARLKKKERAKRHELFISDLYENLIQPSNEKNKDITWLESNLEYNDASILPCFTEQFNLLKLRFQTNS